MTATPNEDIDLTELGRATSELEHAEEVARKRAIRERAPFEGLQIDPEIDFYPEVADREPGDTNFQRWGLDMHPQVSLFTAGFLILFLLWVFLLPDSSSEVLQGLLSWVNNTWGWYFILMGNIFVIACAYFAFSRCGKIRIGGPNALPEFSTPSWYAMLISAGMGIGLMFYSVGEPMYHLNSPSPYWGVEAGTEAAGEAAMATTFFHWGLHPWSIYALVALALAFFAYNRGLPLTFRSVFYPLLKERIYGPWGNAIDILTVLATLFGLATSLGFGVSQVASGLNYVFGLPDSSNSAWLVLLIALITGAATMSVVAGLDSGVKRLSQLNILLALGFMIFILLVGPTLFILSLFSQATGVYMQNLLGTAFWTETLVPESQQGWQASWTIFYWAWWISWSPFVGMFIARISKGRTVRELILGVIAFPTLLSFVWMSVFGGAALNLQLQGIQDVAGAVSQDLSTAMFEMLQAFPLTTIASLLGVALVISFFVTSSDSGSLVVDHLTSGGKLDSPKPQRVFWAVMEGTIAAVLLFSKDGLGSLQAAAVSTGLPFALVLLLMIWSLQKAFSRELDLLEGHYDAEEYKQRHKELISLNTEIESDVAATPAPGGGGGG
jgi:choline/glycine/proline betaine transport protein